MFTTNVTATTSWQKLSTLLVAAGLADTTLIVATQDGYIRNLSTSINLLVAAGYTSAPTGTTYTTLPPGAALLFEAGLNANTVWVQSASSTVTVDFAEGVSALALPSSTAITGVVTLNAGTASIAPLTFTTGTNLTTPVAGANEFDGASFYATVDTTSGRGAVPVQNYQRLTSNGSTISTIANYFGATSNISLVASAFYEIEIFAFFLNTTSGTVVWTLTNSAAPTSQNIIYEMSPTTGIVAPPGTATMLSGQVINDATATLALTATGALTTAVNHYMRMKIWLSNGAGTSLKIQATKSAGTITPLVGSYYTARRLPAASTGTFAA